MQEIQVDIIIQEAIKRINFREEEPTPENILKEMRKAYFFISEGKFHLFFER